VVNSRKLSKVI